MPYVFIELYRQLTLHTKAYLKRALALHAPEVRVTTRTGSRIARNSRDSALPPRGFRRNGDRLLDQVL
jgi:hypothetical protein